MFAVAAVSAVLLCSASLAANLARPADFTRGLQGWAFVTVDPSFARGSRLATRGKILTSIQLGSNNQTLSDVQGEWERSFTVPAGGAANAVLAFDYSVSQSPDYESSERTIVFARLDGTVLLGPPYVSTLAGDGNGGPRIRDAGKARVPLGALSPGQHTVRIGLYVSAADNRNEKSRAIFDNVFITGDPAAAPRPPRRNPEAVAAVSKLTEAQFRRDIRSLANFGDRRYPSPGNERAALWLARQLRQMGYPPQRSPVKSNGDTSKEFSVYGTKLGTEGPSGGMYIVSAHFDGLGGGEAVNDDASGCALVLAVARSLMTATTKKSVRFVFWNAEEVGLLGSQRYADNRQRLQGTREEPAWLGLIQHDQILFDHGPVAAPRQVSDADIDIEFQARSRQAAASQDLAERVSAMSSFYARAYPSMVTNNMRNTDSVPFQDLVASISIRDNTRDEIGAGSNPYWHQPTDLVSTFSDLDYAFGFNIVKMTVGSVWDLASATSR